MDYFFLISETGNASIVSVIPRGVELREERMAFFELRKHCSLVLLLTEIVQHL